MTKSLRWEIQALGQRLATAASAEEAIQRKSSKAKDKDLHDYELKQIVQAIRRLLTRIEDAVPLINLAITASGASLSSSLPSTVSPSRLLQASTFLTAGDSEYSTSSSNYVQIGPTFTLSLYMLFLGHIRPQNEEEVRQSTWKEVIHKADVRLMRVPIDLLYSLPGQTSREDDQRRPNGVAHSLSNEQNNGYFPSQPAASIRPDEYAYQLVIVEDLDDDRVHTFEDDEPQPGPCGTVEQAGIREVVPIHELSKIFYADTGKILNIGSDGENNNPVLLLKRDPNAAPPRRMMDRNEGEESQDWDLENAPAAENGPKETQALMTPDRPSQRPISRASTPLEQKQLVVASDPWRLPPDLDPEWMAFEVYIEAEDSDDELEVDSSKSTKPSRNSRTPSVDPQAALALSRLSISTPTASSPSPQPPIHHPQQPVTPSLPAIRTSLSLLEMLLRLLSLQQFQQAPHLSIPDELLTFFLSESASTGAASNDVQERKRLREEARRHVGFDPYDESPIKRRGEEYQYHSGEASPSQWDGSYSGDVTYDRYGTPIDEGYDTYREQARSMPGTPQTPLLLKNRSRSGTPDRGSNSFPGRAPPRQWTARAGLKGSPVEAGRRGSPLARPATGITDEGLGTSPASESEKKEES